MSKLDKWIDNRILQNVIIWLFVLLIFTMVIQADNRLLTAATLIAFISPAIYINNLIILPLYFKNRRVIASILFFTNIIVFTVLGVTLLSDFLKEYEWRMFYNIFGVILLSILFGTTLKISRDSFFRRQQEKEAELKLLKAQLNPHFLFNTLNNLYGLSVIKSTKLPDLMLKLSDLLRYSLYETKEMHVPLEKEIQYLENYMSLEKIRLEDQTKIEFLKQGDFSKNSIAPMLLIVFVENAFKHLGITKDNENSVSINLKLEKEQLQFKCTNTIDRNSVHTEILEKGKSGIGLKNAKKRLALIYPESHDLKVSHGESIYQIELKLDL